MLDELREAIEKLPERGAKSYLFHILLRVHLLKNSADSQEENIELAKKLHKSNKGFIKSARLIGEVIGHLDEPIGDGFAEYRVRSLIYNGVFAIKGIPKSMRYYSIKLKEF
ncbi:DUF3658 domain-containing protein [Cytobacillus firmus]|uniref:DUF3658 domain-containing protein n=1 Tax=Cytobacillus firmus TaxID=1399 RepID=UPI0022284AB7|nr:DUF3658 domain-containing protein [Cytobacillus firmus]